MLCSKSVNAVRILGEMSAMSIGQSTTNIFLYHPLGVVCQFMLENYNGGSSTQLLHIVILKNT